MPARPSPPPRKKPSDAPPLRAVRGKRDDDVGDDIDDSDLRRKRVEEELSKPTLAAPADDDDPTKGEWLFKQNDMVLGPVTAIVLVERIKAGELSADTPIARDGQPFKPMKLVPLFREAHEATLELARRIEEERQYNAKVRNARIAQVAIFALMILVPAAGGAVAGRAAMILKPWDKTADWIAKAPPLVDLPPRPPEVKKAEPVPPPEKESPEETEPEKNGGGEKHSVRVAHNGKRGDDKRGDDKKGDDKKGEESAPPEKSQGFVKELTNEQAIAPLKDPTVRSALGACFKFEVENNADMPTPLNLAYTITEEGRSANVEITNREERGRPIQECVKKALALARWPRFEGERKNVTVPFNIKKPPKPSSSGPVEGRKK